MTIPAEQLSAYPPYAELILRGEDLDPQKVTELLGILPSKSFKRGDKRRGKGVWPHGLWLITSSAENKDLDLMSHIRWLVDRVEPIKDRLLQFQMNSRIDIEISCFWIMPSSNERLIFDPALLTHLSDLGIQVELDIYTREQNP